MRDVTGFGAKGDGETDDTAALQHALDAGGNMLRFNKGAYRITQPLLVDLARQGCCAISGDGGATRLRMEGPGPAIRIVGAHTGTAAPSTVADQVWEKERFPTVEGLEILGAHPEAVGIELRGTMQATVSRALIRGCRHGIHLVERNRNFILDSSHLYDNHEYGLFFDQCNLHQVNIHGNHISYNKRAGIRSIGGDVHNVQITGNDIEYNNAGGVEELMTDGGAEIWFEALDGIISEVTLASNTIQATIEPGGANVRIWGGEKDSPRGARLIAITGNVLGSQTRGIDVRHAQRIAVTGNTIYDSADLSLFAEDCSGLLFSANTLVWRGDESDPPRDGILLRRCDNCSISNCLTQRLCYGSPERGAGITLETCADVAVTDCQILDSLVRGVELRDCIRCRVTNNSIVDRRATPGMIHAIRVAGAGHGNLVRHNMLGGATDKLIACEEGLAIVDGNVGVD